MRKGLERSDRVCHKGLPAARGGCMSATIHLVTDRSTFEHSWRDALTASGLAPRSMHPTALATDVAPGRVFVIDGAATGYDEDELLTAVGLARAVGAVC